MPRWNASDAAVSPLMVLRSEAGVGVPPVFFFQAKDGIRGIGLTGVQTCALPISAGSHRGGRPGARVGSARRRRRAEGARPRGPEPALARLGTGDVPAVPRRPLRRGGAGWARSEERRVGKKDIKRLSRSE